VRYQKLDLNLLSALKVLLEKKNVTRAGETLFVTQSAMSGILARLRDYFDDPLIVQVGRRMELTPLAESLIEPVNDVLLRIDTSIITRPEFNPGKIKRNFVIEISDYVGQVFLCDVLRRIHGEAPGITWTFRSPSAHSSSELESGDIDFLIHPAPFALVSQPSEPLFEDAYVIVVAAENARIGEAITLDEYLDCGHVAFKSDNQGLPMFESWFAHRFDDTTRRIEVTTHSFQLLPQLVAGTQRVATLHARMAQHIPDNLPVRLVRPLFEMPNMLEILQWHHYRDLDPGHQWVRQHMIEMARAMPSLDSMRTAGIPLPGKEQQYDIKAPLRGNQVLRR